MKQPYATVGVICALPIEASSLTKQKTAVGQTIVLKNNLLVHVSGMGDEQARAGAQNLINRGVTTLISWGTAGGLESTLRRGQLMLPDQVINEGNQVFSVDKLWQDHLRTSLARHVVINQGTLLQANQLVASVADKRQLFTQYRAAAVDMESAAIAAVAHAAQAKFLVVRSIVDSAHFAFPAWLQQSLNGFGEVQPWKLMSKFCAQPLRVRELVHIAGAFKAAKTTLRKAAFFLNQYVSTTATH